MYPSTRSYCFRFTNGPAMLLKSFGSPYGNVSKDPRTISTPSSYRDRGSSIRVVIAQPWPECMQTMPDDGNTVEKSASSSTTLADLPPSSRNTRFNVSADRAAMRLPTAVEPVNEIMSTRGSPVTISPASAGSDPVTTFTTPGGMSVSSATILPMNVAEYGVSGAGFSTTVHPAANAGPSLDRLRMNGKFHGVI